MLPNPVGKEDATGRRFRGVSETSPALLEPGFEAVGLMITSDTGGGRSSTSPSPKYQRFVLRISPTSKAIHRGPALVVELNAGNWT